MFDGHIAKIKRTYIVNKVGAIKVSGSLTTSTGAVDLTDGQVGLINLSSNAHANGAKIALNDFIDGGVTTTYVPEIKIVQGTSASASPASDNRPGTKRPFEGSATIEADEKIQINVKAARAGSNSVWSLSSINVADVTDYQTRIAFRGEYHDIFKSGGKVAVPAYTSSFVSPDYTQLIADSVLGSTAQSLDHLVKNMVVEINKNSTGLRGTRPTDSNNELVMAMAIKPAGQASATATMGGVGATTSITIAGTVLAITAGADVTASAVVIVNAILASAPLIALGITASNVAGVVTILAPGVAGNAVTVTAIGADFTLSGGTFSGGVGIGVSELAVGTPVSIVKINGPSGNAITKTHSFTAEEILSLRKAYFSTTLIGSIILADVSTTTGTPTVPSVDASVISLMGLDRPFFAGEDRLKETKTRLDVGVISGFNFSTVSNVELSRAGEAVGSVRDIKLGYEETQARRDNDVQYRGQGATVISYPSDIAALTAVQDMVSISHSKAKSSGMRTIAVQETLVLTAASVDANGTSVNLPGGTVTLGSSTLLIVTEVLDWARQNGAHVQVRYDA